MAERVKLEFRDVARVAAEAVNATIDHSDIRGSKPHAHPSGAASH